MAQVFGIAMDVISRVTFAILADPQAQKGF